MGAREVSEDGGKMLWEGGLQRLLLRLLDADETTGFRLGVEIGIQGPLGVSSSPELFLLQKTTRIQTIRSTPMCLLSPGPLHKLAPLLGVTAPSTLSLKIWLIPLICVTAAFSQPP